MIVITGSVTVRPEHRAEALILGTAHSRRSRSESGCIAHNCHTDAEDENRIVFVEEWADMDAVRAHFAVPESGKFVRDLSALADEAPIMAIYRTEPVSRKIASVAHRQIDNCANPASLHPIAKS